MSEWEDVGVDLSGIGKRLMQLDLKGRRAVVTGVGRPQRRRPARRHGS